MQSAGHGGSGSLGTDHKVVRRGLSYHKATPKEQCKRELRQSATELETMERAMKAFQAIHKSGKRRQRAR